MNIKDIKGYDEFKKHCSFELCTKRYPDWIGSEKYIVITDDAEKDLLEAFPEIMKALSPYVIVGSYFSSLNEAERYNTNKHASQIGLSIDSVEDYEDLAEGFMVEDFSENLCNRDALSKAMTCLTESQRSRVIRCFFDGMTPLEIARQDGVKHSSVYESISSALVKMKDFLS